MIHPPIPTYCGCVWTVHTIKKHPASPPCTGGQTTGRSVSTGSGLPPASGSLGLFKTNSASHVHRKLHYISQHIVSYGATRFKGRQTFMLGELRFTLRSFYKVEVQWKLRVHSCHRFQELLTSAWQFTLVSDQYYVSQVKELHAEISVVVTPTISISLHSSTTAVKSTNFDIMGQSTTC